jgi:hypothetical protein
MQYIALYCMSYTIVCDTVCFSIIKRDEYIPYFLNSNDYRRAVYYNQPCKMRYTRFLILLGIC